MIIGITGYCYDANGERRVAGAGKDKAADHLVEQHKFVKVGLADPLKRICKEVYDFSDAQLWGPSEFREAPDFRYPRGPQQWRDAYHREHELAQQAIAVGDTKQAAAYLRAAAGYGSEGWLTPRYALQQLGTEWGRNCFYATWIAYGLRIASTLSLGRYTYSQQHGLVFCEDKEQARTNVVFSDIRFFNEYNALKEVGGYIVRVTRRSVESFSTGTDNRHQSERELSSWNDDKFDHVIDNNATLHDLTLRVDRMLDNFKGKILPYDEAQADVPPALRSQKAT